MRPSAIPRALCLCAGLALVGVVRAEAQHEAKRTLLTPPTELLGEFRDDYGNAFRITDSLFFQLPRMRFRIVEWNVAERFLIAQNAADNPSDAGLWTRIDWMPFSGM